MKKILIVEDDDAIHCLMKELLSKENYDTYDAYSGTEALIYLEKEKFDLVLLDLMLPGLKGEDIISKSIGTPIIVLSAKAAIEDKVNCLSLGANDYITKPFDTKELLARIEVQLRRQGSPERKALIYKSLELQNDNHTLLIKSQKINLTKTEYAILKHLILNAPQVVPKNKLLDLISSDTEDCDENSLKVHISNIRKKLREVSDDNYIESVWGIGFKLAD